MTERAGQEGSSARRETMSVCAEARPDELEAALDRLARLSPLPPVRELRAGETGLVMLRGRAGGDGAAFNLGEATVTRAAVTLEIDQDSAGPIGFAYHLGRDAAKARRAAIIDALWQVAERRDAVAHALAPVRDRLQAEQALRARQASATRVDFFTLVRGED